MGDILPLSFESLLLPFLGWKSAESAQSFFGSQASFGSSFVGENISGAKISLSRSHRLRLRSLFDGLATREEVVSGSQRWWFEARRKKKSAGISEGRGKKLGKQKCQGLEWIDRGQKQVLYSFFLLAFLSHEKMKKAGIYWNTFSCRLTPHYFLWEKGSFFLRWQPKSN